MLTLESRIGETGIGIHGTPPRLHCGLPAHPLLFSHFGVGLQHRHLERRDRKTPNLILWLLGSSHTRSIEHDNCCRCAAYVCFRGVKRTCRFALHMSAFDPSGHDRSRCHAATRLRRPAIWSASLAASSPTPDKNEDVILDNHCRPIKYMPGTSVMPCQ